MDDTAPNSAPRALTAVCAALACCATAIFAFRSVQSDLWLDELLTFTLVQADSLPKLWSGIITGIDGNPPLYLTLAWLLSHGVPFLEPSAGLLKVANVVATIGAIIALYRAGLRAASNLACWIGTFLFVALNENVVFIAFELRTYALYFCLAALAVLFGQRLIEHRRRRDIVALAIIYSALTLSHTFGIAYVICISLAGALSQARLGWRGVRPIVIATCPAVVAFACWLPFFIRQSAVGRPYIWIGRPDLAELLQSLFTTPLVMWIASIEFYIIAGMAIWSMRNYRRDDFRSLTWDDDWQPQRYALLLVLGLLAVTLSVWIVSLTLFPLFVPRYFTPQLIITFAVNAAFCELAVRLIRRRSAVTFGRFAIASTVLAPLLFVAVLMDREPLNRTVPCADNAGIAFENAFVSGDIPVIAESPHVWLPRSHYANHPANYKFPLDWDVVLKYPERARGNATDYHIMESLRAWSGTRSILTTEEVVGNFPQFLVIEQPGRAWFYNLRNTRDVVAEKLADATGGDACTLWKVTSVKARP